LTWGHAITRAVDHSAGTAAAATIVIDPVTAAAAAARNDQNFY
jgi:hypothetical protein